MSLMAISSFVCDIGDGAAKLNTCAERSNQKVLVGFEPTHFRLARGMWMSYRKTTRP